MTDSRFGWAGFYMEFADRLLVHKGDRGELVAKVREVCNSLGYNYLDNSGTANEATGLPDICPFTTMGTFNRGISSANRKRIATEIGRFLGVKEPVPESFDGIPTLNNQNSVVFWDRNDIGALWQVFDDAIQLAANEDEYTRQSFVDSYDRALEGKGIGKDLTMGLFWMRPHRFVPLDGKSSQYIAGSLGAALPDSIPPDGHEYLELAEGLQRRFANTDFPVKSFQELSLAAYEPTTLGPSSAVWLIRAGAQGQDEDSNLDHGLASLGWEEVPDLTGVADLDAVRDRVRQGFPVASNHYIGSAAGQLATFVQDIQEGDIVVLPLKTRAGLVALGRITGPYSYQEVEGAQRHTRAVDWIRTDVPRSDFGQELQSSLNFNRTVHRIQGHGATARIESVLSGGRVPSGTVPTPISEVTPYAVADIIDDGCFLEESSLRMMLNRLEVKKNLILQGPPGTGKTWLAKRLAFALVGHKDERRVRRFQFHPNLSYEDFIRGYRPDGEGRLTLVDGPLLEVINVAKSSHPDAYVMVIEEINRGNPAQILGEMLTLLEADKRDAGEALRLAHPRSETERVYVPDNVYVIGTMNIADRSIALVDLALRRRFAFVELVPKFGEVWQNWVNSQSGVPRDFLMTIEGRITVLNERIAGDPRLGPQFCIGHSYVTPAPGILIGDPIGWFTEVVETEIGPLLEEYWFDKTSEDAENAKSELLSGL